MNMLIKENKPSSFWDDFIANSWQKEYKVLESFIDPQTLTEDDAFNIYLKDFDTFVNNKGTRATIKMFVDGSPVNPADGCEWGLIPQSDDSNLKSYFARVSDALQGKEFCVVLDRANLDAVTRNKIYRVLREIYSRLGYIAPNSFAFFFFGEYTKTPFGAHIHDCAAECDSTFIVSLKGKKKVWVWPEGYDELHPDYNGSRDITPYINDATEIEAEPGEMIYFPSYTPHIGESVVKDSFNLFVAVKPASDCTNAFLGYIDFNLEEFVDESAMNRARSYLSLLSTRYKKSVQHIKQKHRENSRLHCDVNDLQKSAQTIPEEILNAAKMVKTFLPAKTIELICQKFWLSVLSSYGMVSRVDVESSNKPALQSTDRIRLLSDHPLLWGEAGDTVILAAASHTFELNINARPVIEAMLAKLSENSTVTIAELIGLVSNKLGDKGTDAFNQNDVMELLNHLNRLDIFELNQ